MALQRYISKCLTTCILRKPMKLTKKSFGVAAFTDSCGVGTFKLPKWCQLVCEMPGILTAVSSISLGLTSHGKNFSLHSQWDGK